MFNQAIANLLAAIKRTDASLAALTQEADAIEDYYEPVSLARRRFNAWRSSHEGQQFKQTLYERQGGQCAHGQCGLKGQQLPIDYFEIDHKLPLSLHPQLALDKNNLCLLCTPCNRRKGQA